MISRSADIKAALRSRQRGFFLNPYRFGSASQSTILLMHCEGVNGGTVFTDDSPAGRTSTRLGGAITSTEQSFSGSSSLKFPTSGSAVTYPASGDFTLGLSDFLLKCAVFLTSAPKVYKGLIACDKIGGTRGWILGLGDGGSYINNGVFFVGFNGALIISVESSFALSLNTWHEIGVRREAGILKLYVNNVLVSTDASNTTLSIVNPNSPIVLGSLWLASGVNPSTNTPGYMDEISFTKNI